MQSHLKVERFVDEVDRLVREYIRVHVLVWYGQVKCFLMQKTVIHIHIDDNNEILLLNLQQIIYLFGGC